MRRKQTASERRFAEWCEVQGMLSLTLDCTARRGFPRHAVFIPDGRVSLIEWKQPGGRLSYHQSDFGRHLAAIGHRVQVVHSFEEAREVVLIRKGEE